MKRIYIIIIILLSAGITSANGQGILKKVANSMKDELLGTVKPAGSGNQEPEPQCACQQPVQVLDMGGPLMLDYREISINTMDDGSLVVHSLHTEDYYIVKGGKTTGPYPPDDPRVAGYSDYDDPGNNAEQLMARFGNYIKRSGEKYLIEFRGKTYGPFAEIGSFTVTLSGNWFAAMVIENIPVKEDEGRRMEQAINNAKSDQERMELAMQFAQQMQQKVADAGGAAGMSPRLVTNVEGSTFNPLTGGSAQGRWKYDEIVVSAYDKVSDLKGNLLVTLKPEMAGADKILLSSDNRRYAIYSYGTLTFNDGKILTDLFNPHLVSESGSIFLAYMYYSPKRNAIMECRIPF